MRPSLAHALVFIAFCAFCTVLATQDARLTARRFGDRSSGAQVEVLAQKDPLARLDRTFASVAPASADDEVDVGERSEQEASRSEQPDLLHNAARTPRLLERRHKHHKHHHHHHTHGRGMHGHHRGTHSAAQRTSAHPKSACTAPSHDTVAIGSGSAAFGAGVGGGTSGGSGTHKTPSNDGAIATGAGTDGSVSAAGYLRWHNHFRDKHGVQQLSWRKDLQDAAQAAADKCKFEHTHGQYGENIYASTYDPSVSEVLSSWYNEISQYDFKDGGGFSEATGHFTQIVWSDTDAVGCAKTSCSAADLGFGNFGGDGYVIFCEYNPPGNVMGEFRKEVPAPQSQSQSQPQSNDRQTGTTAKHSSSSTSRQHSSHSWHSEKSWTTGS